MVTKLTNVISWPGAPLIISVVQLINKGLEVRFQAKQTIILRNNKVIYEVKRKDDLSILYLEEEKPDDGIESVLPPPPTAAATAPEDLRKQTAGDETPMVPGPKQLYQVLQTKEAEQKSGVFQDQTTYVLPGNSAASVPEGAESVLSKAIAPNETAKRKRKHDDDNDEEELAKNFKF